MPLTRRIGCTGGRLPHRDTTSVQLPPTRSGGFARQRSYRVPGESDVNELRERPRSADLTTRSTSSLAPATGLDTPVTPPRAGIGRNSKFSESFGRLGRSISHPASELQEAAVEATRSHSPTGGRFTAGWVPEHQRQQDQEQDFDQQQQQHQQQQQVEDTQAPVKEKRSSSFGGLRRPSKPPSTTRRFEDIDTPTHGGSPAGVEGDSASSLADAPPSAAHMLHGSAPEQQPEQGASHSGASASL